MEYALWAAVCVVAFLLGKWSLTWFPPAPESSTVRASQECGDNFCQGRSDPRCAAGNCTWHCNLNCRGACLEAFKRSDKAEELAREALRKARAE